MPGFQGDLWNKNMNLGILLGHAQKAPLSFGKNSKFYRRSLSIKD